MFVVLGSRRSLPSAVQRRVLLNNCERSELLIRQVYQFELGCIKQIAHGLIRIPFLYTLGVNQYSSDWSVCTVLKMTNGWRTGKEWLNRPRFYSGVHVLRTS